MWLIVIKRQSEVFREADYGVCEMLQASWWASEEDQVIHEGHGSFGSDVESMMILNKTS